MSLIIRERGLPKFSLSTVWHLSDRCAGLSLAAQGLYVAGIAHAYRTASDGRLPGPERKLSAALAQQLDEVRPALTELLETGAWTEDELGYTIVGFLDDHPSASTIERTREQRRLRSLKGIHAKYHALNDDPECDYCQAAALGDASGAPSKDTAKDAGEASFPGATASCLRNGTEPDLKEPDLTSRTLLPADAGEEARAHDYRNELYRVFVDQLGYEPSTTHEKGAWGNALAQLNEVGATPAQLVQVIEEYRLEWDVKCTPMAVVKNWGSLRADVAAYS